MRILTLLNLLILFSTGTAWSKSESICHQVDGIYKNSSVRIEKLQFLSLVDIFSFNNAIKLTLTLAGEDLVFTRTSIDVRKNTMMNFVVLNSGLNQMASVQMDRTPNAALRAKAFYGNLVIKHLNKDLKGRDFPKFMTYNFYCTF